MAAPQPDPAAAAAAAGPPARVQRRRAPRLPRPPRLHDPRMLVLPRENPSASQLGADVIAARAKLATRARPRFVDAVGNKYYARSSLATTAGQPGQIFLMQRFTGPRHPPGRAAQFDVPLMGTRIKLWSIEDGTLVEANFADILAAPKSYGGRASRRHQPRALLIRLRF